MTNHFVNAFNKGKKSGLLILLSTGFYSGFFPYVPGTSGSAVGVIIYFFISQYSLLYYIILLTAIFFIGVWVSGKAEIIFNQKDHKFIVIDEIEGFLIAMFLLPRTLSFVIAGFILFRLLDIAKPFSRFERLSGGLGVMADDIIAGLMTNILLQLFRLLT